MDKALYLCISMHHRELVEAVSPQDAKTFMGNAHPDDGNINTYLATDDDRKIFQAAARIELTPRKRFKAEQLDWVQQMNGKP